MDRQYSFLIVYGDESFRELCARFLTAQGHRSVPARDGQEALSLLRREWFDVALVDLRLPKLDGLQLVKIIKAEKPSPEVVILTGYGSISSAVEAMRLGAYDYVTKPFQLHEMELVISRLLKTKKLESENRMLKKRREEIYRVEQFGTVIGSGDHVRGCIVGTTPKMKEAFTRVAAASRNRMPALVRGERGTGKELVARAIHYQSPEAEKPFVTMACAGMSKRLMESHLFGHVKGAFTGATMSLPGLLRAASGGTLFIDEIAEVLPELQAKLARVIEEQEYLPLGAAQPDPADVRILVGTSRGVTESLRDGKLREDLYYRVSAQTIELPPLRERVDDIPHLVRHFVQKVAREYDVAARELADDAMEALLHHEWPGNVRELEQAIERAFAACEGDRIALTDLPPSVRGRGSVEWSLSGRKVPSLEEAERALIEMALEVAKGKKAVAARYLRIDRQRLYRKIKKYKLDPKLGRA
jgi:DNA-binding NtrC family response regulator